VRGKVADFQTVSRSFRGRQGDYIDSSQALESRLASLIAQPCW
jgi:hypothetical protein